MSGFRPKKEVSSETPSDGVEPAVQKTCEKTSVDMKPVAAIMRKVVLLVALALTIGWVFGVRFHLDALKSAATVEADTVLELKSGQSVVGKIVSERTDSLVFRMEGSEVPFSRSEIKNLRPATPEEAALETVGSGKRPFITVRPEDTFQYKLKNNKKLF